MKYLNLALAIILLIVLLVMYFSNTINFSTNMNFFWDNNIKSWIFILYTMIFSFLSWCFLAFAIKWFLSKKTNYLDDDWLDL
jgi:hypothetical protein